MQANKTVIVIGSDCWLVIGYTGLAYINDKPTDQFMAEAIAGHELGGMWGMWNAGTQLHYREITNRISNAISSAFANLSWDERKHTITLLGVGVQFQHRMSTAALMLHRRVRHLMFETVISAHDVVHQEAARRTPSMFSFDHGHIGDVDETIYNAMRVKLRDRGLESPDVFRDIMMDAIAATGKQSPVVGEDVIGVILKPIENLIRIHFKAADPISRPKLAEVSKQANIK